MPNIFMLGAYSDDESRSMKAETQLHRDVNKGLWVDQPSRPIAKGRPGSSENSTPQARPAHSPQYSRPPEVGPSLFGEAYDWLDDLANTNDIAGLIADSHADVLAKDIGSWVAANGKVYKNGFYGNQHFQSAAVAEQKALSLSRARVMGRLGKPSLVLSHGLIAVN